jgi:hypothetical protein
MKVTKIQSRGLVNDEVIEAEAGVGWWDVGRADAKAGRCAVDIIIDSAGIRTNWSQ